MPSPSDSISKIMENAASDVPEDVTAWLGRLVLLYGVPFPYLVPDEDMLPRESIRFFYLDPIWIQCLVQGACSVGNTGYGDSLIDRAMNSWVQPNQSGSEDRGVVVNKAAASVRDRLRMQYEGVVLPPESEDLDWPLTGFLLRSSVVDGWRGLEIMAYQMTDEQKSAWAEKNAQEKIEMRKSFPALKPLRIEQLARDVMLGIFNGQIGQLVIRQPQEGLHFGLTPENGSFTKTLRELGYKHPERAGENLDASAINLSQEGLMRDKRVINIKNLANEMKSHLSVSGELQEDKFTSAEFAVEMIEAAGEFTFIPKPGLRSGVIR